jgi:tryptophan-rich sensory protein
MSFLDSGDDPKLAKRRPLLIFILVTLAVGGIGSIVTTPAIPGWYASLTHPAIAPPNWVFAPVWTTLYVMMAVAAWRVWRITGLKSSAMLAYAVQLALNLGWSLIFFGLHGVGAALAEIMLLILAIIATMALFARTDRIAWLLMTPYLAWVCFAAALNHAFWLTNP